MPTKAPTKEPEAPEPYIRQQSKKAPPVNFGGLEGMLWERALKTPADDDADWQDAALCKETDPEAFFPEKGGSTREAKRVCLVCDVSGQCLEYALDNDERFGIWGGLSERERRKLKKRQTQAAGVPT